MVLVALTLPLAAYFCVRGVDIPLRPGTRSPLHSITWDCVDVVGVPLGMVVPPAQAGIAVAVAMVASAPFDRLSPVFRNRTYSAAVMGCALYTACQLGRLITHNIDGDAGVAAGVAAAVLVFEGFTYLGNIALLQPKDSTTRLVLYPALFAVPLLATIAIAVTVAYRDTAYVSVAILALFPVLLIEVMRRFGRTSVDLEARDSERADMIRAVTEAAERQRGNVAADIHDGPLQSVLASQALLSDISDGARTSDHDLKRAQEWLTASAEEMRQIVRGLVPEALAALGLHEAIMRDAAMLARPPAQQISVSYQIEHRLPISAEIILYRVAHEALMNAVRHSGAKRVLVEVQSEQDEVTLSVSDDGAGGASVASDLEQSQGHLGLAMVRDRIGAAGGRFELDSGSSRGTRLTVTLPLVMRHQPVSSSRAARFATWWASPPTGQARPTDR
jgi:signal transduction histidine kinase